MRVQSQKVVEVELHFYIGTNLNTLLALVISVQFMFSKGGGIHVIISMNNVLTKTYQHSMPEWFG